MCDYVNGTVDGMIMMGYPGSVNRRAVTARALTFSALGLLCHLFLVSAAVIKSINVDMDLSRVVRRVDERFLSVTIDASLMAEEKFMYLLG